MHPCDRRAPNIGLQVESMQGGRVAGESRREHAGGGVLLRAWLCSWSGSPVHGD